MPSALACRRTKPSRPRVEDPDVALMLRVQQDEPGAFAELAERFRPRIYARLYRLHTRQSQCGSAGP